MQSGDQHSSGIPEEYRMGSLEFRITVSCNPYQQSHLEYIDTAYLSTGFLRYYLGYNKNNKNILESKYRTIRIELSGILLFLLS